MRVDQPRHQERVAQIHASAAAAARRDPPSPDQAEPPVEEPSSAQNHRATRNFGEAYFVASFSAFGAFFSFSAGAAASVHSIKAMLAASPRRRVASLRMRV